MTATLLSVQPRNSCQLSERLFVSNFPWQTPLLNPAGSARHESVDIVDIVLISGISHESDTELISGISHESVDIVLISGISHESDTELIGGISH